MFFDESPHLALLRYLAKGSLKQNLTRSLRLWVILKFLYGLEALTIPQSFTLAEWRNAFFHISHPRQDNKSTPHDAECACYQTLGEWVSYDAQDKIWREAIAPYLPLSWEQFLEQRLFSVTRRTLQYDLDYLITLGWLERQGKSYFKVAKFPDLPQLTRPDKSSALPLLNPDLEAIARNLTEPLGGYQRFFIDVDYVVPRDYIDRVEDIQEQLKSLWQEAIISPICLRYSSVRYGNINCIVYPVCLYYHRRAIYLCGFGQSPKKNSEWYNYRLDKITTIYPISWQSEQIPQNLILAYNQQKLPTPERVEELLSQAWGFDFYLPIKPLLLRFERSFHDNYIKNTQRHETFQQITYKAAKSLIRQQTLNEALLAAINLRSPEDAYYHAYYRDGDISVQHRLYSWRPHLEIFLPLELRQDMKSIIQQEWDYYF